MLHSSWKQQNVVRAPEGSVYKGELELGSPAGLEEWRSGNKSSLEGFQGWEHRELRWNIWNWICRCDWEHRKHWEEGKVQHKVSEISLWPSLMLLL